MTPEQGLDLEALEAMVDRHGLDGVLSILTEICNEKSEHVLVNWQDKALAKNWTVNARVIEKLAAAIR